MSHTSMNFHFIKSVLVERTKHPDGTNTLDFTFIDAEDQTVSITAFSKEFLTLVDATEVFEIKVAA